MKTPLQTETELLSGYQELEKKIARYCQRTNQTKTKWIRRNKAIGKKLKVKAWKQLPIGRINPFAVDSIAKKQCQESSEILRLPSLKKKKVTVAENRHRNNNSVEESIPKVNEAKILSFCCHVQIIERPYDENEAVCPLENYHVILAGWLRQTVSPRDKRHSKRHLQNAKEEDRE